MLDYIENSKSSIAFWEGRDLDKPHTLGGFKGTWAFSDHALIPQDLNNFLMEAFHPVEKIKKIPLEEINRVMNEVWEGPGSMAKLVRITAEMKANRQAGMIASSNLKLDEVRTIDDYDENEFSFKPLSDKELTESNDEEDC